MEGAPSPAVNIIVSIIPIVGIVMGSVVIFFYLLFAHRQRVLLIQKGEIQRRKFELDSFSLLAGLLLFCIGIGLTVFFYFKEGFDYSILSGLVPLSIGMSLLLFFVIRIRMRGHG